MSKLLDYMKEVYSKSKQKELEWKPVYLNNMPSGGIRGIYTDMVFNLDGKYRYFKFTIEYMSRCDADGISHPEEGVNYYVLHFLELDDLDEPITIPEPSDERVFFDDTSNASLVNDYGRFRYVFDDESTARKVVGHELQMRIYPLQFVLSDEEEREWDSFTEQF